MAGTLYEFAVRHPFSQDAFHVASLKLPVRAAYGSVARTRAGALARPAQPSQVTRSTQRYDSRT